MLFRSSVLGMGLSFRAWVKRERFQLQQRLDALEAQQMRLERAGERADALCQSLELANRQRTDAPPAADAPARRETEDVYQRAWSRLDEGAPPAVVARELGLGVAEVELMGRMMHLRRRN